jgi:hypothetical protein
MKNGTLTASCLNFFQNEQHTVLADADKCAAEKHDIKNVNGILRCVLSETPVNAEHPYVANVISIAGDVKTDKAETLTFVIDQPRVDVPLTEFRSIKFKPGDVVTLAANGCVQTGGSGRTWKSYTNPTGSDAETYYSGTAWIDGVMGGPNEKIAGLLNVAWKVPVPKDPKLAQEYFLQLGYLDTQGDYLDNGYWNHDDGNDDQCLNKGPAWIEVKVTSGGVGNGVQLSAHSKPFDLVWDMNNEDFNGLPLNPKWTYQLAPPPNEPPVPDFASTCGPAITTSSFGVINYGGTGININELASRCTSQAPNVDLGDLSLIELATAFGYCSGTLDGHMLWSLSTYTGNFSFADWSGDTAAGNLGLKDGDYGVNLVNVDTDNNPTLAGQTTKESAVGLEFRDFETVHLAGSAFWKQLVNSVENGTQPPPEAMMGGTAGLNGVAVGVMGIDGVHGGYAELHPVFALALNTHETQVNDRLQQTWVFFLRNSGSDGGCSSQTSTWPSSLGNNEYFVQLPWPEGATGAEVVGPTEFFSWQDQQPKGAILSSEDKGWTLIDVKFPPNGEFGVDGSFTVEYSFPAGHKAPPKRTVRPPEGATAKETQFTAADFAAKVKDPILAARFTKEAAVLQLPAVPAPKRVPMVFDTSLAPRRKTQGKASRGHLTKPESHPDPVRGQLDTAAQQLLDKYKLQTNK